MIALTVMFIFLGVFLFVAAPGTMGGPMFRVPFWYDALYDDLYVLGVVGTIVGLVWMVRIHRADPEPDQHAWRYRAKR